MGLSSTGTTVREREDEQRSAARMTPFDWAMEEVTLAILSLTDAMIDNDRVEIAQECKEGRRVYKNLVEAYPRLQLQAAERDSLFRELSLLGVQLNQCQSVLRAPVAVDD
jgi:hypothetical protein